MTHESFLDRLKVDPSRTDCKLTAEHQEIWTTPFLNIVGFEFQEMTSRLIEETNSYRMAVDRSKAPVVIGRGQLGSVSIHSNWQRPKAKSRPYLLRQFFYVHAYSQGLMTASRGFGGDSCNNAFAESFLAAPECSLHRM